ncbi:MAG: hypothetical protein RLZZ444_2207 [Pseudomonadota bacterium]|jgi:hypothetical protein
MAAIYSRGAARFRHATTGEIFTIPADELEWAEFAADERQMGTEVGYSAEIDHPALGTLSWELWEYPIGAENMRETHANGHELLENIDFSLQDFPVDDEPEEDLPLALRLAALPAQLDELDQLLAALRDRSPMIGHNRAPAEFRLDIAPEQIDEARASIADIRGELTKPDAAETTSPETIQRAEGRLRKLATTVGGWVRSAAVLAATGAATSVAGLVTKEVISQNAALHALIVTIADTLSSWLQFLGIL